MGGSPPSPPKAIDKQAQQEAENAAAANRKARGYKSTVLSTMMANSGKSTTLG
jgi:hypothetical protein